ncbi:MAG: hypothetical protein JWR37_5280 [Mycobacterium sp.]|jgi:uncharacterized protein (DUF305 family)|nr:hypothetical protein [Mycobacterium sp.]
MFTSTTYFKVAVAAAAAVALLAAGCGSNGSASSPASGTSTSPGMSGSMPGMDHGGSASPSASAAARTDYNDADVTFLQMMYPHHAQAVEMARLVPGRSHNQQVIALAANIEKAQAPEMEQIAALLQSFGKPAPTDSGQTDGMPGMMTGDQMNTLKALSGKDFDRMWLQMMIDHHSGAVTMSNTELAAGTNPDAKSLAQKIIANQQAEINQMRGMLAQT